MAPATVFGLEVSSTEPLSFLGAGRAEPTGRALAISLEPGDRPHWPRDARLLSDERDRDGGVVFQIHRDPERGYRFDGPAYGETILDAGGTRAWGSPGAVDLDGWQRLLVAQVLPFAAALRGLEVLHASGVSTGSGAVALLGPSGAGKTSLALALEREELGEILADDVLALEPTGESLVAHPGAPIAAVARSEAERLRESGATPRGELLAVNEREEISRAELAAAPAPLAAIFILDRRADGPASPRFVADPDPQVLLGSTFNLLLSSPERLGRLLDVGARMGSLPVERVSSGPEVAPPALARAIGGRLAEIGVPA